MKYEIGQKVWDKVNKRHYQVAGYEDGFYLLQDGFGGCPFEQEEQHLTAPRRGRPNLVTTPSQENAKSLKNKIGICPQAGIWTVDDLLSLERDYEITVARWRARQEQDNRLFVKDTTPRTTISTASKEEIQNALHKVVMKKK